MIIVLCMLAASAFAFVGYSFDDGPVEKVAFLFCGIFTGLAIVMYSESKQPDAEEPDSIDDPVKACIRQLEAERDEARRELERLRPKS